MINLKGGNKLKILISCDMEGIAGIVSDDQVSRSGQDYQRAREVMTKEVNYAVQGAFDGGATEVYVNDSHGSMRNLVPELMHKEAQLITGNLKELSMVEGLKEGIAGVFLVGYHAKRGTINGIHDHTYSGVVVRSVKINDVELGEIGFNALICGSFNVPVLLITGDDQACGEALSLMPHLKTAQVKKAVSRHSAICMHPEKAGELIRAKAKQALKIINEVEPYQLQGPFQLELEVNRTDMADRAQLMPGVTRVAPTTLVYQNDDLVTLFKGYRVMISLGS